MKIYGQLESASLEVLGTNPTSTAQGRVWFNSATSQFMLDDGTSKISLLRSDKDIVFGRSATASQNLRFNRSGVNRLQLVSATDVTADGSISNVLAELDSKVPNYNGTGSLPTVGQSGRLAMNTADKAIYYDDGTSWKKVGSGTGSGIKNYIATENAYFESTHSWATFANGTTFTDGATGTATNLTLATTTTASEVLEGTTSLRITKAAASAQGNGLSTTFTLDRQDYGKPLYFSAELDATGAGYASDLTLYAFDVTNGQILAVLNDTSGVIPAKKGKFMARILTNANTAQVRVACMVTTTSTSAWNVLLDSVICTASVTQIEAPIVTSWQSFVPTLYAGTGTITNTAPTAKWRRVGDTMEVRGTIQWIGTPGTWTTLSVGLPSGYSVDSTKTSGTNWLLLGTNSWAKTGTTGGGTGVVIYAAADRVTLYTDATGGTAIGSNIPSYNFSGTFPYTWAAGDYITFQYSVPIANWNASAIISTTDASLSTVKARYSTAVTGAVPASGTLYNFTTQTYDTHGCVTTGTGWKFTVPRKGYYKVITSMSILSAASASRYDTYLVKNGTVARSSYHTTTAAMVETVQMDETIYLQAGDYLQIQFGETVDGGTFTSDQSVTFEEMPDFTTFGVTGTFELLTTTSNTVASPGNSFWVAMSGNSLTLTPGVWRLFGQIAHDTAGTTNYSTMNVNWYAANGTNTLTAPATLATATGLSILTPFRENLWIWPGLTSSGVAPAPMIMVRVVQTTTVYLVSNSGMATPANARLTAYATAERVQ